MSQDPLLDKMDALLKKHRGSQDANVSSPQGEAASPLTDEENSPPPDAWLPVLTDVVVMGTIPESRSEEESEGHAGMAEETVTDSAQEAPRTDTPAPVEASETEGISDTLAEQLMGELEPRLITLLQSKVAPQIRNSLDDTVSALLAQLDVNIREIVRDAINERLGKP